GRDGDGAVQGAQLPGHPQDEALGEGAHVLSRLLPRPEGGEDIGRRRPREIDLEEHLQGALAGAPALAQLTRPAPTAAPFPRRRRRPPPPCSRPCRPRGPGPGPRSPW